MIFLRFPISFSNCSINFHFMTFCMFFFSLTNPIDMHKFVIYYANCLLIYIFSRVSLTGAKESKQSREKRFFRFDNDYLLQCLLRRRHLLRKWHVNKLFASSSSSFRDINDLFRIQFYVSITLTLNGASTMCNDSPTFTYYAKNNE